MEKPPKNSLPKQVIRYGVSVVVSVLIVLLAVMRTTRTDESEAPLIFVRYGGGFGEPLGISFNPNNLTEEHYFLHSGEIDEPTLKAFCDNYSQRSEIKKIRHFAISFFDDTSVNMRSAQRTDEEKKHLKAYYLKSWDADFTTTSQELQVYHPNAFDQLGLK